MRIVVLALGGVFDIGLSSVLNVLGTAEHLAGAAGSQARRGRFEVQVAGLRRRVRTERGLQVPVSSLPSEAPDLVVVPGLGALTPEALRARLEKPDVAEAAELLRDWGARRTTLTAACTGTFVLGRTGLLDGHRATTTWWLAPFFRELHPAVELDDSRMVVESGNLVTAGAALAHLDLGLWILRRRSSALAAQVARYLVIEPHAPQAAFAIPDQLAHEDAVVERFEAWARRHFAESFSLAAAARAAGASERTLARRLRAVLGRTPLAYVQALRVERAVHLLQTTGASVEAIAEAVGYADGVTLRALLRRRMGRSVREIRSRA